MIPEISKPAVCIHIVTMTRFIYVYLSRDRSDGMRYTLAILFTVMVHSCSGQMNDIQTGADQLEKVLPQLTGKRLAVVANQTSEVQGTHLVDTLLALGGNQFTIQKVFAPEHGFRGDIDDGVLVSDETDPVTGVPIISLYGKHKKPSEEDLSGVDLVIFDIQDVGTRFYTYISTLHYVMEACAENGVPLLVLDRPNPNDGYIDGPILEPQFITFVGMHPIPVVYALTIGEVAMMINGEKWLRDGVQCDLTVVPCANYYHGRPYSLPVKPSPNLPNDHAIRIYPSTCFFEGTVISEGRGTLMPFEVYGHPDLPGSFSFVPEGIRGMSMYPKLKGETCYGEDLREFTPEGGWNRIELRWLLDAYAKFPDKKNFFLPFFESLAGTDALRKQIVAGWTEERIRSSWQAGLDRYRETRKRYLLYDDGL
jgi:uncharacterized protein YbbC (DUF1343 family)